MALDPDFIEDCPYGLGGLLLDEILAIEPEKSRLLARLPTHDDLPLTREQKTHPVRHPRHVSGGLMVHLTGMVAFAHAYYVLDLKHRDGWIGYGVRIHSARFTALATPGDPMELECIATKIRRIRDQVFATYEFRFTQNGAMVYEGKQTAVWSKVSEA